MLIFIRLLFSSSCALIAENLFLRRQLALFQEREIKPRPTTLAARLAMIVLGQLFAWREALVIVKPATFIKWHRVSFRLLWRWKSRKQGRPPLPKNLGELIRRMDRENPTWGEERIADELLLKLGIKVSARTVAKYLNGNRPRGKTGGQRWSAFVRNHAKGIVACDFFVSVTATFRVVYVFVAIEVGSRRVLHFNVTEHPTAEWTIQQFREYVGHYNRGRPHSSLGPGIPEPIQAKVPAGPHRHKLPKGHRVISTPILGGLHHEYSLKKEAA